MTRTPGEHPEGVLFGTLRYNITCGVHRSWSPTPRNVVDGIRECSIDRGSKHRCGRRLKLL